jgi:hypothetical protein
MICSGPFFTSIGYLFWEILDYRFGRNLVPYNFLSLRFDTSTDDNSRSKDMDIFDARLFKPLS